jgi:hypothetical protein
LALLAAISSTTPARAQDSTAPGKPATPCGGTEFHQFDFWLGDWDAYDAGDPTKVVARNHVTPMLGGCAVREVYQQTDGLVGESFSAYDASRGRWHQSWVTNRGTLLLLDGGLNGDRMTLTASQNSPGGTESLLRGVWHREGSDVRETVDRSTDGGKTWSLVFDIVFRRHGKE